jgi:hypothetical protein
MNPDETIPPKTAPPKPEPEPQADQHCPVCGATLLQEKCKVVCRSPTCTYRIIFNCAEF